MMVVAYEVRMSEAAERWKNGHAFAREPTKVWPHAVWMKSWWMHITAYHNHLRVCCDIFLDEFE